MAKRKYFGTDGVRGRVGHAPVTPELVMRLGYSAGQALVGREHLPKGERPAVLIGKDTRVSGYLLEAALEAGFAASGVDVMLAGPVPTPAVAYLTRALRLQAGVVISASHNPYYDNGIKFFSASGAKLPDALEAVIEAGMDEPVGCVDSAGLGRASRVNDAAGRYIEFCKSTFPVEQDLRGLRIVVDCAHGAAYHIAPKVFHELGAEVIAVGHEPNGLNINQGVGATQPDHLRSKVLAHQADYGVALDGDGDRLVMCDQDGTVYDGDSLIYVIARARVQQGDLLGGGIAGTLMSNLGFELAVRALGVDFHRAAVGDRYVMEALKERGWRLGGENSGHIICLDRHTTGDGIISALQVLAALRQMNAGLREVCAELQLFPQVLVNVRFASRFDWASDEAIADAVKSAEARLGRDGRVLLRASGTEPLIRVMVEGKDDVLVRQLAEDIADVVKAAAEH